MNKQNFPDINKLFEDFKDRDDMLRGVTRYSLYSPMFYRTNLYTHSLHLGWIINELMPNLNQAFGVKVNMDKLLVMALVHDDLEIIMGDVQAAHKEAMDKKQADELDKTEKQAINEIAQRFPEKIGQYNYKDLLTEAQALETLESQILRYVDLLDGMCEALHEIYGGNKTFATNAVDEYGRHPTPFELYIPRMSKFTETYPETKPLFDTDSPLLNIPQVINFKNIAQSHSPHTKESLLKDVSYPLYDHWKKMIREYADEDEYKNLYNKKE